MLRYFFPIVVIMSLMNCSSSTDCDLNKEFTFFNDAKLALCDDIQHTTLQGFDTSVGRFDIDGTELMQYSIGWSEYFSILEGTVKSENAINSTFNYVETDSTLRVQFFVDNGGAPFANTTYEFYSENVSEKDLILDIMKTMELP